LRTPLAFTIAEDKKPKAPSFTPILSELHSWELWSFTYTILYGNGNERIPVGVDDGSHVLLPVSSAIPTAMDIHQNRQPSSRGSGRRVHIEIQAIFVTGNSSYGSECS
jgi:hypothetical protein